MSALRGRIVGKDLDKRRNMALRLITTSDERLVGASAVGALDAGRAASGRALVLVPSLTCGLEVQRELAAAGLTAGVDCETPSTWTDLRWALYGDGRSLVTRGLRPVLMSLVAAGHEMAPLDGGEGTVALLCDVVARALPWLPVAGERASLTAGETRALELTDAYAETLAEKGFVEPCEATSLLPAMMGEQGASVPPCVFLGFDEFNRVARELVCALARLGEVTVFVRVLEGEASGRVLASAGRLREAAAAAGVEVIDEVVTAAGPISREPELNSLLGALFRPGSEALRPTGAVRLLEPAGPLAQDEAACRHIQGLVSEGAKRVVVVSPDVRATWRSLAPKLHARGVSVRGNLRLSVEETGAGAGLLRLADSVARLVELDASWPSKEELASPECLPDMSWWPPRGLADFLMGASSRAGAEVAWRRDVSWRGNRILSPAAVLATLQNQSLTSPAVAAATRDLVQGHVGAAATRLLLAAAQPAQGEDGAPVEQPAEPSAEESLARAADTAALAALAEAARTLKAAGVSLDVGYSLTELIRLVHAALMGSSVQVRPELACDGATCVVDVVSPADAAALAPASADALVYLGLDAGTTTVPAPGGAFERLLDAAGVEAPQDPLDASRARFASALRVPTRSLALVCPSHDAAATETFPSVMLSEVLACYSEANASGEMRCALESAPSSRLDEGSVEENIGAEPVAPAVHEVAPRAEAGHLDPALRRLVVVPRDGQAELPGGRLSLSASQVETYLECPFKWFTLRRLGLDDMDATFTNMQMGTFAHRVLEVTHRRLFQEAAQAAGLLGGELGEEPENGASFWFDPLVRVPGSRVDRQTLPHAIELLRAEFAEHYAHQRAEGKTRAKQALVPHAPSELRRLEELERDLISTLEYEASLFDGFEPRLFEGDFGGKSGRPATYAGADFVGTIDRLDVDAEGRAVVIDYKHKGALFDEYALLPRGDQDWDAGFVLPNRVQTLIYASIAREFFSSEGIRVVGSLYLGTKGSHQVTGAISAIDSARCLGGALTERQLERISLPVPGARNFDELLDRTEEALAGVIERMSAGEIDARPRSPKACEWCPVLSCERRQ